MSRKVPASRKVRASREFPASRKVPASEKRQVIRCPYCTYIIPYREGMELYAIKCPNCGKKYFTI